MLKSRIICSTREASSLKTLVLGLLVTCMLLSTCAVRKSIEALFQGSARTESGMGKGFKKIRATTDNLYVGSQICSTSDQTTLQNVELNGSKALDSQLPHALFLTTVFGFIASAMLALLHSRTSISFSKASFAFDSAPLYIKNRLLLI